MLTLNLPIKTAYLIYSLAKQINEYRDFFIKEEKKLIEKFNANVAENGQILFEEENQRNDFIKEYNSLMQYELEDFKPIELNMNNVGDINLTAADLFILDGVINFK